MWCLWHVYVLLLGWHFQCRLVGPSVLCREIGSFDFKLLCFQVEVHEVRMGHQFDFESVDALN